MSKGLPAIDPATEAAGDLDYKALFEAEVEKRRSLEGRVGSLMQRISTLTANDQKDAQGANRLGRKLADRRVDIASSLFEALIVRGEAVPQGDELTDLAYSAVDAADSLLDALTDDEDERS